MSFTDKLKLIIDVDTKGAVSGLSGLKGKMSEAEGFFGKLKAGAGGLKDIFNDLGPGAKAGIAAGGITAIGAAAVSVVSDFADLGVEVGQFADATGLSTEESSRWVEVADEMGISSQTLESVLGKMNKSIDPEKWKALGIEIAKTKQGTTDVSGSFLNAIEHLHSIGDAAQQAKEGAALFGKGWQQVAELVGDGADQIRQKLADVESQKILSESDVKDAREFRHTMDELHDALQDVALTLGKDLLPLVKAAANQFTTMIHATEGAAGAVAGVGDSFTHLVGRGKEIPKMFADIEAAMKAVQVAGEGVGAGAELGLSQMNDELGHQAANVSAVIDVAEQYNQQAREGKAAIEAQAAAVERAAASNKTYTDTLHAEVDALHAAADALNDQISAAENAADSQLALNDASEAFSEAAANTVAVLKDKGAASKDYKQAVEDERDALIATAKAQQRLSDDQATALGVTVTATQHIDDLNTALESQARFASPAARKAAYDYIGQLNQIPPEKLTEIQALVDQGKLDEADAAMKEASRTREAAIIADAKTAQANADLDALAHDRFANIYARTIAVGATLGLPGKAGGGAVQSGHDYVVGEHGAEIVHMGGNGSVIPAGPTSEILSGGGASSGGDTVVFQIRAVPTDREITVAMARARRRGRLA